VRVRVRTRMRMRMRARVRVWVTVKVCVREGAGGKRGKWTHLTKEAMPLRIRMRMKIRMRGRVRVTVKVCVWGGRRMGEVDASEYKSKERICVVFSRKRWKGHPCVRQREREPRGTTRNAFRIIIEFPRETLCPDAPSQAHSEPCA